MESSDNRRQSDALPSMGYMEFERSAREAAQFHQRHPSIARASILTASPISPTTSLAPPPPQLPFPSSSSAINTNGYFSPPESRRTSGNDDAGRQSLPSLQEALLDRLDKPFTAPSPMQTPPLGQGSFSGASASHPPPMPRSQPSESLPSVQPPPGSSGPQIYAPPPPPPPSAPAPHSSGPPAPIHHHEAYDRRPSQEHTNTRTLGPNPYSQTQPPPPTIPAIRPPESYPPPPSSGYPSHPYPPPPPPHHNSPPQYSPTPSSSSYHNSSQSSQYPFPSHAPSAPLPPSQPPYPPQPSTAPPSYSYPPRDPNYQSHESIPPPQTSPGSKGGLKRGSGYGSAIERALSISAIRRDLESTKEHSSQIYHIIQQCQDFLPGGQTHSAGFESSRRCFDDALRYSIQITETLQNCQQAFQDLSAKEYAEQNAQKMSSSHISEYGGGDDNHGYADDTRSNGSQQPDTKKMRRGRAAPPGRCHSCQRAETPEWRRGPDGARTLCNACGLHYAKLTRKLSKNSMGSAGGGGSLASGRKAANSPLP